MNLVRCELVGGPRDGDILNLPADKIADELRVAWRTPGGIIEVVYVKAGVTISNPGSANEVMSRATYVHGRRIT